MFQRIVKASAAEVPTAPPPQVNARTASKIKGHPHPGSMIELPDGQVIHLQFDENPNEVRNGALVVEVIDALVDHLAVYQERGHPMASRETALVITKLQEAGLWCHARSIDRDKRGVRYQDKA